MCSPLLNIKGFKEVPHNIDIDILFSPSRVCLIVRDKGFCVYLLSVLLEEQYFVQLVL